MYEDIYELNSTVFAVVLNDDHFYRVNNDHGVRGKASQCFCPISIILPVVESVLHPTMPVILPKVRAETGCIRLFVLRCFVSTIDVEFHCRLAGKISASQPVFPKTLSRERHYHF